jgi:two-component system nitrate/nitrite response regulator NarL
VSFPHASGLTAIRRIHEVSPATKVVMLSGSIGNSLVAGALAEGAQGFVGKERPVGVIIEALEMARQGHPAVDLLELEDALESLRWYDGRTALFRAATRGVGS